MAHTRTVHLDPLVTTFVRRDGTVQLGWVPEKAVILTPPEGMAASAILSLLALLDGRRPRPHIVWRALDLGFSANRTSRLLSELDEAGLLIRGDGRRDDDPLPIPTRPERVHVVGRGPLSDAIAAGLSSAPVKVTRSNGAATRYSYAEVARWKADVVILADDLVPDPRIVGDLLRHEIAHLMVRIREGTGVVGPFVRPGETSCLRCADLTRCSLDPEWPHISAQMLGTVGHGTRATVLATAALALAQLESLLAEPASSPESIDRTIELDVAASSMSKRVWSKHPQCECWTR